MPTTTTTTTTTSGSSTTTATVTATVAAPAPLTLYTAKSSLKILASVEKVAAVANDFTAVAKIAGNLVASFEVTDGNNVGSQRSIEMAGPLAGKKWAVALRAMELPEGHVDKRADIGAGLLSPVAYGDFMKLFGKWLQTKVSYAPMAESERAARADFRDPERGEPRMQPTRAGGKFVRGPAKALTDEGDRVVKPQTATFIFRISIGTSDIM